MHYAARSLSDQTLHVDGLRFLDCEFRKVRLVCSGGEPPVFGGCHFHECEWSIEGAAARTPQYLKFIHDHGAPGMFDRLIDAIRRP